MQPAVFSPIFAPNSSGWWQESTPRTRLAHKEVGSGIREMGPDNQSCFGAKGKVACPGPEGLGGEQLRLREAERLTGDSWDGG